MVLLDFVIVPIEPASEEFSGSQPNPANIGHLSKACDSLSSEMRARFPHSEPLSSPGVEAAIWNNWREGRHGGRRKKASTEAAMKMKILHRFFAGKQQHMGKLERTLAF